MNLTELMKGVSPKGRKLDKEKQKDGGRTVPCIKANWCCGMERNLAGSRTEKRDRSLYGIPDKSEERNRISKKERAANDFSRTKLRNSEQLPGVLPGKWIRPRVWAA